jgi:uncharacterized protein (UPF0179 family)
MTIAKNIEVNKTYKVNHSRKGKFIGKLVSNDGEWVKIEISDGKAQALLEMNEAYVGETITVRRTFCTFEEVAQ